MLTLSEAAHSLRRRFTLPALTPDAQGRFALQMGDLTVGFYPTDDGPDYFLQTRLGTADANDEGLLEDLLASHVIGPRARAGVLSLDPESAVYITERVDHAHVDEVLLFQLLREFVAHAQSWASRLPAEAGAPTSPDRSVPVWTIDPARLA